MAIVPMPDGPRVNPTVPQADNISLIAPQENKAEKMALEGYNKSANYLTKAVDAAYERFSKAKADEAYNNIQIETEEILRGENGALRLEGGQVLGGDKPFVDDYMGRIKKVVEDNAQGLDVYQKRLLQRRVGQFMANRNAELTRHQVTQAEAFTTSVNKTKAQIAARNIATDPGNIAGVKRNREDIEQAIRDMNPGAPKETVDQAIADATSKALVTGIEAFIANGNPERAQALFAHYKGKGITAFDALSLQPKIRKALLEKQNKMQEQSVMQATVQSLTPRGIAESTLTAGDGLPFDDKRFNSTASACTDVGKPEWAAEAYLLGEAKTKELLAKWKEDGDAIVKRLQESKPGSKEREDAKADMTQFLNANPLESALSPTQKNALDNYRNKTELVNSGDKDTIREQILSANPDIDKKLLDKTVSAVFEQRQRTIKVAKLQAARQASDVFAKLTNGTRFKDIPVTERGYLTESQLAGLKEYDRRKALGSFTTDTNLFCKYRYNIEALKALDWADLYGFSGYLKESDFNTLVAQKQSLEKSDYKEDTKGIQDAVKDALVRLGYSDNKSSAAKAMYNRAFRVITEHITDQVNIDQGKGWDTERIRTEVNKYAANKFTKPMFLYWGTSKEKVGELFTNPNALGGDDSLKKILNAGLIQAGYPEPNNLDRSELVLDFLSNPDKVLPGEDAMVEAIPSQELNNIRKQFPGADNHTIVRAALKARLITRGQE